MKGIELSKAFFHKFGKPMLEKDFAEHLDKMAIGLVGHGSECFGFDDEISQDHDFEPSFCIWITDKLEKEIGFKLFRAYSKLPKEYMGIKNQGRSALGANEKGVMTISQFYSKYTGRDGAPICWQDWLYTPSHYFAEATNGEIFSDPLGEFTKIRNEIKYGMPEDVRLKKIASSSLFMAQSGQYNYKRCISHGEMASARLALNEFVVNAANVIFLLKKSHAPYYKWIFKSMRNLPDHSDFADILEEILLIPPEETLKIELAVERVSERIIEEFKRQGITDATCNFLESHAYSVNDKISNSEIRNLPIML